MIFCTGCGKRLEEGDKFCMACGTLMDQAEITPIIAPLGKSVTTPLVQRTAPPPQRATSAPAAASAPVRRATPAPAPVPQAAAPAKSGGALKIILIILGVLVLIGILAAGAIGYGIYKAKKAFHVEETEGGTTVTTPFGKVSGGEKGAAYKIADELGITVYPGATAVEGSGGSISIGGIHIGGAEFETSDSLDKVGEFYRGKYPNSTVSTTNENSQAIMVKSDKGMVTINLEQGEKTKITISHMGGPTPAAQ